MILPVLQVPGLEHVPDQPEGPLVAYLLRQYSEKNTMVDFTEAVGDVSFDEPCGPGPGVLDFPERGMAAASFPEPVRPVRKARLVDCLQQEAHHFADQLIGPRRQAQRAELPVLFRDVDAAGRGEPVPLVPHQLDDLIDRAPSPCGPLLAVSRLAGRYPGDYYGHSATIGLASLR